MSPRSLPDREPGREVVSIVLIDSHCHLDFEVLANDRAGVLARAKAAGVTRHGDDLDPGEALRRDHRDRRGASRGLVLGRHASAQRPRRARHRDRRPRAAQPAPALRRDRRGRARLPLRGRLRRAGHGLPPPHRGRARNRPSPSSSTRDRPTRTPRRSSKKRPQGRGPSPSFCTAFPPALPSPSGASRSAATSRSRAS